VINTAQQMVIHAEKNAETQCRDIRTLNPTYTRRKNGPGAQLVSRQLCKKPNVVNRLRAYQQVKNRNTNGNFPEITIQLANLISTR
jgi:hypothetical protein